jgi:Uma2 family endonuclease
MTLLTTIPHQDFSLPAARLWRISVERYHEMIRSGVLTEDDSLELLEGYLVEKMTINPPHAMITAILFRLFVTLIPAGYFVGSQQPITLHDSETEPDILVVRGRERDYFSRHPYAAEAPLLVEVSDRTLQNDQTQKKRIYARAEIPVYWIVNIPERQLEVYSEPSGATFNPTYRQLRTFGISEQAPVQIDDQVVGFILVADLFPSELEE